MAKQKDDAKSSAKVKEISYKYSKEQILKSKKFSDKKDILSAVIEEDILYSIEDVKKIIDKFLKMEVK